MKSRYKEKKFASKKILEINGFQTISLFQNERNESHPQMRLENVRKRSLEFREAMLSKSKPIPFYKSVDLIRVPYPTKYGLLNATTVLTPYMHILNRLFILQFKNSTGLKTMLFSPSDIAANGETPFFKRLASKFGAASSIMEPFLAPKISTVEKALETAGIPPEKIDYISYDHLHTQDIRKWLGTENKAGYFPNAKLIIMKQEWESAEAVIAPQKDWYCPHGLEGVPIEKVIFLDLDTQLGEGVALIKTPGHTEGNHSLVAHTEEGLMVTSENGVSPDSYSPLNSRIPGLKAFAKNTEMEVVLNGNTLEGGLDQYISMVKEKTIAGASKRNPDFCNIVSSSELTSYWGFPGLKPTFSFGPLEFGKVQ